MKCFALAICLILWLTIIACPQPAQSQENQVENPNKKQSEQAERMKKILGEMHNETGTPILPDTSSLEILDNPTKEKFFMAMREYYEYRASGYKHRMELFKWQLFSSRIIFFVVIFLVLAGVYFSWVQFRTAIKEKRKPNPAVKNGAPELVQANKSEITEVEASIKGIKVSSPILGVIILVISLLFFYLYLIYVYPINNVL